MLIGGAVLAFAIGVSLGVLGGGGSILTVPVLYVFGIAAHDAIATSLIVVGVTSATALVGHARRGRVRWKLGLAFGAVSMTAAFAGGLLGAELPPRALAVGFAIAALAAGIAMLRRPAARSPTRAPSHRRVLAIAAGVGALTGVLGAGGGFVIVPALTLAGLAMPEAVATSLLAIALNAAAGLAGAATHASVDGRIAVSVTVLAVAGSLVGARLERRLSSHHVQRAFGWLVIAVGVATAAHAAVWR